MYSFDYPNGVDLLQSIYDRMVQISLCHLDTVMIHLLFIIFNYYLKKKHYYFLLLLFIYYLWFCQGITRWCLSSCLFTLGSPGINRFLGNSHGTGGDQETLSMRECSTFTERISSIMDGYFLSRKAVFRLSPCFLNSLVQRCLS